MSEAGGQPVRLVTDSVEATLLIGRTLGAAARPGDVIGLIGELGAGKTQLVRGIAGGMGIDPARVSSPTFVLVHEYEAAGAALLVHIDAYRLRTSDELETIGWDTQSDPPGRELRRGAVVAIEWADRMAAWLGDDWLEVRMAHGGDEHQGDGDGQSRQITLIGHGSWSGRIAPIVGGVA